MLTTRKVDQGESCGWKSSEIEELKDGGVERRIGARAQEERKCYVIAGHGNEVSIHHIEYTSSRHLNLSIFRAP